MTPCIRHQRRSLVEIFRPIRTAGRYAGSDQLERLSRGVSDDEVYVNTTRPMWRKSKASGASNCVEVALADDFACVRDSKSPEDGPILRFAARQWNSFVESIRLDEFR